MVLTRSAVVVGSLFHLGIKNQKKYEEGVSCPNCHDNLTDYQKSRFRMRQKQINLAKEAGKRHIFQKEY